MTSSGRKSENIYENKIGANYAMRNKCAIYYMCHRVVKKKNTEIGATYFFSSP